MRSTAAYTFPPAAPGYVPKPRPVEVWEHCGDSRADPPPGSRFRRRIIRGDDGLIVGEEAAIKAWLGSYLFKPGDFRSRNRSYPWTNQQRRNNHPMGHACYTGEVHVCAWLFEHGGAAEDIFSRNRDGCTLMHLACTKGHLLVCKWLFEVGAAEQISATSNYGSPPMYWAAGGGHLAVCKWLYEMGATADISKTTNNNDTPMHIASYNGHLAVCKWLFKMGASQNVAAANNNNVTPMFQAAQRGHLEVCKWLYANGGGSAIRTMNNRGDTPLSMAVLFNRMSVCKWLILKGAMTDPVTDHVDERIVEHDTVRIDERLAPRRVALLNWAHGLLATRSTFLHIVHCASVALPDDDRTASEENKRHSVRCHLPIIPICELERVAEFSGIMIGRRLRIIRELVTAMTNVIERSEAAARRTEEGERKRRESEIEELD